MVQIDFLLEQNILTTPIMLKRLIFFILLTISVTSSTVFATSLKFEKFPLNEKLPSNSVIRVFNDKEGYMWFGTKDGLCRFDGYDIKVFRSSALTPGKLTNNEIQCIAEDNQHKIWVGTLEGIEIIDKKNFSISHFKHELIDHERINSILVDTEGFIWIGTSSYGVIRIHPESGETEHYNTDKNSPIVLPSNTLNNIYQDKSGRIWLSFWKYGLCYIDKGSKKVQMVSKIGINNNPFRFFEDKDGLFWICTWGDGIYNLTVNGKQTSVKPLVMSKKSTGTLNEIVYSITQDNKEGKIWVVTFVGLSIIQKEADGTFTVTKGDSFFDEDANKLFHEIAKDRWGNLWIGSVGEGVFKLNFNQLAIQNFPLNEVTQTMNVPSYVTRLLETPSGNVYISINRIGLFSLNQKTGESRRLSNPVAKRLNSISSMIYVKKTNEVWVTNEGEDLIYIFREKGSELEFVSYFSIKNTKFSNENTITSMFEDSKGNVWIGANDGLYIKSTNKPVKLVSDKYRSAGAIKEDKLNNIWIGTGKEGVYICKPTLKNNNYTYPFKEIPLRINNYRSLSVQSICSTNNGQVFIGTREGCLYEYDSKKNTATDISGLYGITEEGIMDIIADNSGVLWISTIKRIIRYNPETHAATYYSNADGLLVSSFFKDACLKLNSGLIMFGGNKGICVFNPKNQSLTNSPTKQNVALTDILIQNKSIFDDIDSEHFDAEKQRIKLKYSENNLSIEFAALDNAAANKIQYAYKLSGVDKNWNYVGNNRRFVNYANLPSGSYTFMVKASDENGSWSDNVTTLNVVIMPPLYRTWWAYLLYLAFAIVLANIVFRTISNRIRLRNELKISKIEKDKSEELAQVKLRYFTNISHELLTPLTIIMLQIESLQNKIKAESAQFDLMRDNVIRLKRLIQQILVFRKTESGNMKLKIQKDDIVAFVNNICQSNFKPLVNEKSIHFSIDVEQKNYMANFDPDKLDKIIYNLLSNAFKYTPAHGEIAVKISFLERDKQTIMRLSVSDSGSGIAEEDLPNIFKRFYISKNADQSQSHGIGLALTYDLLQLHKGSIEVKSKTGEGTVFTIEIPVSANAYTEDEMSDDAIEIEALPELSDNIIAEDLIENDEEQAEKDYTVLIVEDNKELNNLIAENLAGKYHVLTAVNGVKALEIVRENEIDLIVSDVMMPEMDGLTFCKMIKNDVATSHINMLMLTAKNSTEDRIDCYNAGADAYIAKPFELSVLKARVKNLLGKRKQKTESFKTNQEINITSMEYCSIDELFLKQAVKKVEEKISDDTFDFDQFALDMATSKSTLHRKLKSLTGLSPGEFIRNVRLKHAVQMLNNNMGNISEIAFAVGFNDPKYFSRCFKIEFGLTPKEFQENNKAKKA